MKIKVKYKTVFIKMLLKDNLSNLILVIGTLIVGNDAGCKYTNPQWVSTDPTFMTAPSLHLTFNGVNEEDQVAILPTSYLRWLFQKT